MESKKSINMVSILRFALQDRKGLKYLILSGKIAELIRDGSIEPGTKLPTHRDLSFRLGVTPGTVSKTYAELTRIGLATAHVGSGTFVLSDTARAAAKGFRTYSDVEAETIDMSLNQAIPTGLEILYRESFDSILADQVSIEHLHRYAPETGYNDYRTAGAKWISHDKFQAQPSQVVCTNGGQHGLFCSLLAVARPGDLIATEQFTYPGLISASRALGLKLIGLEMDCQGLVPEAFEAACRLYKFSALYCSPVLQNPTTSSMTARCLQDIADICVRNGIVMIEDQTHAVLAGTRTPPLAHFAPDHAIIISSLSKAIASGLRVGFVHAPLRLVERISGMVCSTSWMVTPLPFELAARWIASDQATILLQRQRHEIHRRKSLVADLMRPHRHRTHPDSPHYWIETAEPWRASEICTQLRRRGCYVASVESFAVDRVRGGQFIRASVSLNGADDALLLKGFGTLSQVLTDPEARSLIV